MLRTVAIIAFALVSTGAVAQPAPQQQQMTFDQIVSQRLAAQIGQMTGQLTQLQMQVEILQAQVTDFPKRIAQETAVLKAENEELRRQLEAAKTAAK